MKIAYCIKSLAIHGGIERVISTKANYLARRGYEVVIITTDQKGRDYSFPLAESIKHYDLGLNYEDDNKLGRWGRIKALYQKRSVHKQRLEALLQELKADIVVSTFFEEANILAKIKDRSKKVLELHSSMYRWVYMYPKEQKLLRLVGQARILLDKLLIRKYDQFVVLTNEDKELWGRNDIKVIYNPSPIEKEVEPLKDETKEIKKVLAVGRYFYGKNFDVLIEIWSKISPSFPDWQLEIIGDGPLRSRFEQQVNDLGLKDKVLLTKTTNQIEAYYRQADIMTLISEYEGLPMVLVEAQSMGLPIVAYSCPCGPRDIITDGEDGFLIAPNDREAFAKRLIQLIQDKELRQEMGAKAKENSKRFDLETVMPQWDALFNQLKGLNK